jgi:uncharacterized membrane protein
MDEGQSKAEPDIQMSAADKNKVAAILAYIGPLVVVSYLIAKNDPFVKFHIRQGLVLLVIEAGTWVLASFFWGFGFFFLWNIVRFVTLVFAIIGIVHAAKGEEKALPWIGSYASYFKF